jgi:protein translocase SecG subunit
MSILIWFLTVVMVLDCVLLLLLILVQLPKKDAGMGQAFGGATTDALFGAGSGNALTKMTKYSTAIFLVLTLGLSILNAHQKSTPSSLEEKLKKVQASQPAPAAVPAPAAGITTITNLPAESTNLPAKTNIPAPVVPSTNTPAPAK